jgi:hypothetical protein
MTSAAEMSSQAVFPGLIAIGSAAKAESGVVAKMAAPIKGEKATLMKKSPISLLKVDSLNILELGDNYFYCVNVIIFLCVG